MRCSESHLGTAVSAELFVNLADGNGHMLKTLVEETETLCFHLLKLLMASLSYASAGLKC